MKTFMAKEGSVPKTWYAVDAEGKVLGRMATRIATVLQGKHKPQYTPHVDTGDFVIVFNARKVKLTGNKLKDKMYKRYSGYPGGLKTKPAGEVLEKHPDRVIRLAVRRMLPKSKLGEKMMKKLKVYAGHEHPHSAQQPKELTFNYKV
ncbi:MAG: 50S ribosomal protein L13 [Candidatus Brocadiales bacterium]